MNIAWQYLDKKAATISALKDYDSMRRLAAQTKEQMAQASARMTALGSGVPRDTPGGGFRPHGGEDRIAGAMDEMDILREKYSQVQAYMSWFRAGWSALTEDERYVLRQFYMEGDQSQTDRVLDICETYSIERTSAYKKKDKALARLSLMLYGR